MAIKKSGGYIIVTTVKKVTGIYFRSMIGGESMEVMADYLPYDSSNDVFNTLKSIKNEKNPIKRFINRILGNSKTVEMLMEDDKINMNDYDVINIYIRNLRSPIYFQRVKYEAHAISTSENNGIREFIIRRYYDSEEAYNNDECPIKADVIVKTAVGEYMSITDNNPRDYDYTTHSFEKILDTDLNVAS